MMAGKIIYYSDEGILKRAVLGNSIGFLDGGKKICVQVFVDQIETFIKLSDIVVGRKYLEDWGIYDE